MEIDEVGLSFKGAGLAADRAERISRLIFADLHAMMIDNWRDLEQSAEINHLEVGPVVVSFDTMDDESIARASATEIYRTLLLAT
jgi:hypothetical protein